jgi:hypothetical protein
MRRYALVLRVQYDETGRLAGQIIAPGDDRPVPFASLEELWTRLLEYLHLPAAALPPAPARSDAAISNDEKESQ